ncbi:hypothetical protein [Paenibacillus zanthoxyli]|uniref:hypothetical protein n=1 Tax=Paenibacillus zanthoxyli TaxID=369399 RepID=UPI000472684D|nr:hypothetical protein [Paenibacillus zanthoxyli]
MRPIQYGQPQAEHLSGIQAPIPIREFRGLSTFDPLSLSESFFTDMSNMDSTDFPALVTRPGYSVIGGVGSRVLGMGVWQDRELHVIFNDGTWRRWNGSTWDVLVGGLNPSAEWSFTNFDGKLGTVNLIGCNGVDAMRRYDGGSVQELSGAPSNGKYITTYQNRLWCAVGTELWSCALDNPTSWNDFDGNANDSYRKSMESNKGEQINMLTGSLTRLTIGMPGSMHELYGTMPSNFNTRQITEEVGTVNYKAIATLDGFLRIMHGTGIYDYGGGTLPDKTFSEVIGKLLVGGITSESVAGSDGRRLLFNLPPDRLLVYDPRSSVQAWSLWRGITAAQFSVMGGRLYIGDASGRVLRLEGTTDGGAAIDWSVTTKPFNNGSLAQRQRWYKLWLAVELSGSLNVYLSPSITGEDWTLVQTVSGSGPQVRRVIIPVSSFTRENWIRMKISGSGWVKIHEITRQVRQLSIR